MILIFFGSPGAGKGTQADLIAKYFNIPHLSTGNILRQKRLQKDELAKKLSNIMDSGELVPDNILNEIVSNRIENEDCSKGFILDGYPRTMNQALFFNSNLESKNLSITKIIDLIVDQDLIIERIKSRSSKENRQDDKDEIIKTRISKYQFETKPLSDFYKNQNSSNYLEINGNHDIEKINQDIIKILKNDNL